MKVITKVHINDTEEAPPGDNLSHPKTGVGQVAPGDSTAGPWVIRFNDTAEDKVRRELQGTA